MLVLLRVLRSPRETLRACSSFLRRGGKISDQEENVGTYLQLTTLLSLSKKRFLLINSFSVNSLNELGLFSNLQSLQSFALMSHISHNCGTQSIALSWIKILVSSDCVNMFRSAAIPPSRSIEKVPQAR